MGTQSRSGSGVRGAQVAEEMRAVLRLFQSRRARFCGGCGERILTREPHVRVDEGVFHRDCLPESSPT